jgi:hypothetical protein
MTHKQALFLYWGIMADLRIPAYDFLRKKQKEKRKKEPHVYRRHRKNRRETAGKQATLPES